MLELKTGSHPSNREYNLNLFSLIDDILLSKENPLFKKFNEEDFYLDNTEGFISIVKSSYLIKDLTDKQTMRLKNYLLKHIKPYEGFLYVGSLIIEFK